MDKRTIFALLLILVVFWISSELIWKPKQQKVQQEAETAVAESGTTAQTSEPMQEPEKEDIVIEEPESDIPIDNEIVLETEKLRLIFTNRGALLTSVMLKDYFLADKENYVELIPQQEDIFELSFTDFSGNVYNLTNTVFQYTVTPKEIVFSTKTDFGYLEKRFFITDEYKLQMQLRGSELDGLQAYTVAMASGIADTEKYLKTKTRDYQVNYQLNNEQDELKLSKLDEKKELLGNLDWAAIKSKYFMMGIIPEELIDANKLSAFQTNNSPAMNIHVSHQHPNLDHSYKLYFGPIIYDNLVPYGVGIEKIVELGPSFLQWLSKIFKAFLNFLYGIIPSWGICIIIFAIILKLLLYPLTHKSFESSTKMQKVQPMMKEIQTKYKSDPKRMNAELKKLYKEHGVNPLGGCLPMLLQMPVIFALYPILRYSIQLRQASFLWLPDLSEPDPIWALPIVMAVFMFVQQKLMAPSKQATEKMDEKQQAAQQSQKLMMYFLPVMMFFIFKGLSSGLVLYWTVFSVIGSIQQIFIKKKFSKEN